MRRKMARSHIRRWKKREEKGERGQKTAGEGKKGSSVHEEEKDRVFFATIIMQAKGENERRKGRSKFIPLPHCRQANFLAAREREERIERRGMVNCSCSLSLSASTQRLDLVHMT